MVQDRSAGSNDPCDAGSATEPAGDSGAGLVFWLLIALSVVTFAPCMILPAWREYQLADLTLRVRSQQVEAAEAEVEHLQRRLDAIHNDPAVVARLARRELEYRQFGDRFVTVANTVADTVADTAALPTSAIEAWPGTQAGLPGTPGGLTVIEPPLPVARILSYLPDVNYDRLFCASPVRETLLGLSVVLFVAAFAIFWPRVEKWDSRAA